MVRMFPSIESTLFIPGQAGRLELLATPAKFDHEKNAAVICHPHPQMQGTMHNKVVTTLAKTCLELGMPVVRFHYRGVGQSEGRYDHGVGELDDAIRVLTWLKSCFPRRELYLAGFSFGGAIAYKAASRVDVSQLITVSPSVVHFDLTQDPEPTCPWVVVQGEEDDVVPAKDVYTWLQGLTHQSNLIKVPECGHFFHGKLGVLKSVILAYAGIQGKAI